MLLKKILRTLIFVVLVTASNCLLASEFWYADPNVGVAGGIPVDFYSRMESLADWEKALKEIDVYYLRRASARKVDEQSLRQLAKILNRYQIPVALDDGAATWAHGRHPNPDFSGSIKTIKRLRKLGFNIQYIGLQSVLSKIKKAIPGYGDLKNMTMRFKDVTSYMVQVGTVFPHIQIGIIDALPAKLPIAKVKIIYRDFIRELQAHQLTPAFFHLDIPMSYPRKRIKGNSWKKIVELSEFIRKDLNSSVGLVLVSNIGGRQSGERSLYYINQGLKNYLDKGFKPDQFIYNSWYPYPKYSTPDSSNETSLGIFRHIFRFLHRP